MLRPDFTDPAYPGRRFYCWHCALIEGVLAGVPDHTRLLDVERVDWPRPRQAVIDAAGAANQSLPLIVFGGDAGSLAGKDASLAYLAERYGFPEPHP